MKVHYSLIASALLSSSKAQQTQGLRGASSDIDQDTSPGLRGASSDRNLNAFQDPIGQPASREERQLTGQVIVRRKTAQELRTKGKSEKEIKEIREKGMSEIKKNK